ncbi:MAG TPA: DNA-3-methyladenine glycosylase 2 family protein [Acidimicrobiia bacterium]|nr:DNA-3-methyladenine glycosylase 2 family protein [Acidimicrobiia bacterium]
MPTRTFRTLAPVDLRSAIGGYSAGGADPSIVVAPGAAWLALHTPVGPATLHFAGRDPITAEAWGPGAEYALEVAPEACGATDDPGDFEPKHQVVRRLLQRLPGVRITRSGRVVEALLRMVTGQRVTGTEARNGYFTMCRQLGGPAPGPRRLTLPPDPGQLAALGYAALHPWGIERGRAETLIRVARHAGRLDETAQLPLGEAYTRITAIRGVGAWTAGKVGACALGDADAVPVGDYHLPNTVAWALADEDRADDRRMLELLEEFRPHRARVIRLIQAAGISAPKYGPRSAIRDFRKA